MLTQETFRKLFDSHYEELRRYIYYRGGDAALAEDVVQQAFLKVWEKQPVLLPGKERAFLYKVASDEFVDQVRRMKRNAEFGEEMELLTDGLDPADELRVQELAAQYREALAEMKEPQRVVFLMSRKEELTYTEIAARLSLSVKAVEKRMKGALDTLRNALDPS